MPLVPLSIADNEDEDDRARLLGRLMDPADWMDDADEADEADEADDHWP